MLNRPHSALPGRTREAVGAPASDPWRQFASSALLAQTDIYPGKPLTLQALIFAGAVSAAATRWVSDGLAQGGRHLQDRLPGIWQELTRAGIQPGQLARASGPALLQMLDQLVQNRFSLSQSSPLQRNLWLRQALERAVQEQPATQRASMQLTPDQARHLIARQLIQSGVVHQALRDALAQRYLQQLDNANQGVSTQLLVQFQRNLGNSPQLNHDTLIHATVDVLKTQGRLPGGTDIRKFIEQLSWVDKVVANQNPADPFESYRMMANKLGWLLSDSPAAQSQLARMVRLAQSGNDVDKPVQSSPESPPPQRPGGGGQDAPMASMPSTFKTPALPPDLRQVNDQSPEQRDARWREDIRRAKEEADAVVRRHRETVRLRSMTAQELSNEIQGIQNPQVRELVRQSLTKDPWTLSDTGAMSWSTAWRHLVQALRGALPGISAEEDPARQASGASGQTANGADAQQSIAAQQQATSLNRAAELDAVASTIRGIGHFEALAKYLQEVSPNPDFQQWIDDRHSPFLRAVEEAFLRLDRRHGLSGLPTVASEVQSSASKRLWSAAEYERFARLVLALGEDYFRKLPAGLVDHLATHVLYRFSLETYDQGILQRQQQIQGEGGDAQLQIAPDLAPAIRMLRRAQTAPLAQTTEPTTTPGEGDVRILDGLGQPLKGEALIQSPLSRPVLSPLLTIDAGKIPSDLYTQTSMNPLSTHVVIGDIHGNSDLLLKLLSTMARQVSSGQIPKDTVLLFLGDYINKGADPAGVVQIVRALSDTTQGKTSPLPSWLKVTDFERTLKVLREVRMQVLRGNHEDLNSYAAHMAATEDPLAYGRAVSEMLGKGLNHTVVSYLARHPEVFTQADRSWLVQAINNPAVPEKSADGQLHWRWRSGGELSAQQAGDFYRNFQRIWVQALHSSGDLAFFKTLTTAYNSGDVNAFHGGPPLKAEGMLAVVAYLQSNLALPQEVEKQVIWRRYTAEESPFTSQAQEAWQAKLHTGQLFAPNTFTGHTMGGYHDQHRYQFPDGSIYEINSVGVDLGFGLNNLGMVEIKPNGEALLFIAHREGAGIDVDAARLQEALSRHTTELLNRFPE